MLSLPAIDPLFVLSGFCVGAIVGLTGVGGGSLMTPVLVLLFGIHPAAAVGTDLLFAASTKSFGTLVHGFHKSIDWRIVGLLALGSVPASSATLALIVLSGVHSAGTAQIISVVLGAMLLLTAISLFFRRQFLAIATRRIDLSARQQTLATIVTGAVLGVLVSISSVGAGAIGVMVLMLLYPRLPILRVIGSDIAHAVPLTLVAGVGHWLVGSVELSLLASLLLGSIPGIVLAGLIAPRINERLVHLGLASVLVLVAMRLLTS